MKKIVMITVSIIILSVFTGCTNLETNEPEELTDSDGDGIPDIEDIFPFDPSEQYDLDQDYVGDNSDKFPNAHDELQEFLKHPEELEFLDE